MATQQQQENDGQIPPSVRAAMAFLRHADMIRQPVGADSSVPMTGRDLEPDEKRTEQRALELLRNYFDLNATVTQLQLDAIRAKYT